MSSCKALQSFFNFAIIDFFLKDSVEKVLFAFVLLILQNNTSFCRYGPMPFSVYIFWILFICVIFKRSFNFDN